MLDALHEKAYGWIVNAEEKDLDNPDLYAIIAAAIEIVDRGFGGTKYTVSREGGIYRR